MPDLSSLDVDLSQVDLNQVLQKYINSKNLMIIMLVAATITGYFIYKDFSTKETKLKQKIQQSDNKMQVIKDQVQSLKQLNQLTDSLVKPLSPDLAINQLTDYAAQNQVQVLNMTPSGVQNHDLYSVNIIHIKINAPSFQKLIGFLHTIENSPYTFRLNMWVNTSSENLSVSGQVSSEMEVASIQIKT